MSFSINRSSIWPGHYLKPLTGRLTGYWLVCGLLTGTPVVAQTALRAPLSIVPPAMQAALADGQTLPAQDNKLAPRVTARQMKRAVRAVAATPGSDADIVQVGQLGALEDAPVGLEAGFNMAVWQGARLAFITNQMARLPSNMAWFGLYHLERKLHRSANAAPIGTVDNTSWFAARLNRFLALGDNQSVIDLEALTGAAHNDGYAAQALALAHLGRGDDAAACAVKQPTRGTRGQRDTAGFFMQMLVYCQLAAGEFEKAGLTLELNRKTLGADALFRDMAYLLSAQAPLQFAKGRATDTTDTTDTAAQAEADGPLVLPGELTAMQIALLRLAGQALPDKVRHLPAYFMTVLSGDYTQSAALQLRAAHKALRFRQIPAEQFSQVSQLVDLSIFAGPLPPRTPPADGVFLAQALRTIDATPRPQQPRIVGHYLRIALKRNLWTDMIVALDDRLADLRLPRANAPSALPLSEADRAILLPALWQAGLDEQAENLLAIKPTGGLVTRLAHWARPHTEIAQTEIAHVGDNAVGGSASTPIGSLPAADRFALLSPTSKLPVGPQIAEQARPVFAEGQLPEWGRFMVRRDQAEPAEALYLRRELAIYLALGAPVPPPLLAELVLPEAEINALRLAKLAENKWVGDLILALVGQFADTQASAFDAADIQALLANLHRAGLTSQARALAADLLLAHAAELAAVAPYAFLAELKPRMIDAKLLDDPQAQNAPPTSGTP